MSFLDFFFFRGIFISMCSASQVVLTYIISGYDEINYALVAVVFSSTFIVYNLFCGFNIYKKIKSLKEANSYFTIPFYDKLLLILLVVSAFLIFFLLLELHLNSIILLFVLAIVSLLYFIPIVNKKNNLRSIGNLKALLISSVWVGATCIVPLLDLNYTFSIDDVVLLTARFLYVYILVLLFDVRDIKEDMRNNLQTTAVIFGEQGSIVFCMTLTCMFIIFMLSSNINYIYKYALVASALPLFYVILISRRSSYKYFFLFIIDGFLIFQFILILIFKYFY